MPLLSLWAWPRGGSAGGGWTGPCLFWPLCAEAMRVGAMAAALGEVGVGEGMFQASPESDRACMMCSREGCVIRLCPSPSLNKIRFLILWIPWNNSVTVQKVLMGTVGHSVPRYPSVTRDGGRLTARGEAGHEASSSMAPWRVQSAAVPHNQLPPPGPVWFSFSFHGIRELRTPEFAFPFRLGKNI